MCFTCRGRAHILGIRIWVDGDFRNFSSLTKRAVSCALFAEVGAPTRSPLCAR